jgi:hypothetical protein
MNARTFSLPTTEAAYCPEFARFISPQLKVSYQPCRLLKKIVIHFNSWIGLQREAVIHPGCIGSARIEISDSAPPDQCGGLGSFECIE